MRGMVFAHWESGDSTPASLPLWRLPGGQGLCLQFSLCKVGREKGNIMVVKQASSCT